MERHLTAAALTAAGFDARIYVCMYLYMYMYVYIY